MELDKILARLYQERELLTEAIRTLESMAADKELKATNTNRRGRKSMPKAEREAVSRRMRAYWASRRK